MTLTWVQALGPAAGIAIVVRVVARSFGPYFSWVELLDHVSGETEHTRVFRRQAMVRRLAVPFVVTFALGVLLDDSYTLVDGAIVGALAAALILWPMVFGGLPFGVHRNDWMLLPIYGSFVGLFALSGFFGIGAAQAIGRADSFPTFLAETGGIAILTLLAVGILSITYDRSTSTLGQAVDRRTQHHGSADEEAEEA